MLIVAIVAAVAVLCGLIGLCVVGRRRGWCLSAVVKGGAAPAEHYFKNPVEVLVYLLKPQMSSALGVTISQGSGPCWVSQVAEGSVADVGGLRVGDAVLKVNGQTFTSPDGCTDLLKAGTVEQGGCRLLLNVNREAPDAGAPPAAGSSQFNRPPSPLKKPTFKLREPPNLANMIVRSPPHRIAPATPPVDPFKQTW